MILNNKPEIQNDKIDKKWGAGFSLPLWSTFDFGEASSVEEYAFLFGICALIRPKKILEIGTSNGLGFLAMQLGAVMTGTKNQIVTIDKKKTNYEDNTNKVSLDGCEVSHLIGRSEDILERLVIKKAFFDLCLIDGGHDEETVANDWLLASKLSSFWIFHDSSSEPGVKKVISTIKDSGEYSVFNLDYAAGHQVDEPTGEWYQTLNSPGICLVQKKG